MDRAADGNRRTARQDEAGRAAESPDRALARVRQLHRQAVGEGRFGHAARAVRTLHRALAVLESVPQGAPGRAVLEAEVWLSLAVNEGEVHGVERGLAAMAEAEQHATRVHDESLRVRLHSNYGFLATRAGNLGLAAEQLDRARSMIAHADPYDRVYILLNSGNVSLYRGELVKARRLLESAATAAEGANFVDGRFRALHNLGYVRFLAGDIPSALAAMDAAAALDADVSLGIWALDRARILMESGLALEADESLARAGRIFAADRLAQDTGEVEVARAECALLRGDVAAARRFATRARDRFRRRGNTRWMRTAELVLLRGDLAAGRPGARLAPVAARLEQQLRADGLSGPARTAALVGVEALLAAGRPTQAAVIADRLARGARGEPISARVHARYARARLDLARGDRRGARRLIRTGLGELAAYQSRFGSIDLQTASAIHGRRLAELNVQLALDDGRPAGVLAALELGRAVSSRLAAVRPPADEHAAALLTELRQVVEALHGTGGGGTDLVARRRDLERRISARSWTLAGESEVTRAAKPDEIRGAVVAADLSLLAFSRTGRRLHAVVVDAGGMRLVDLGDSLDVEEAVQRTRADFDALAHDRLPGGLRGSVAASLNRSLRRLDAALLEPLGVVDRRTVIVPTGALATLPWAALPSRREVPLTVAPSATAWLTASSGARSPSSGVRAFAGPGLARAAAEATAVAALWPGGAAEPAADRRALLAGFAEASVVHVAAHGRHQTENPLFSAIRLADGPLFAHELQGTAPHVVLSACELGAATVRPGDEALGLTSVLLRHGTRSVIGGVARVGDAAAAEAMIAYHAALARGRASADALATALAAAPEPLPFVCFGAAWTR